MATLNKPSIPDKKSESIKQPVKQFVSTISQEVRELEGNSDPTTHAFVVGLEAKLHAVREHIAQFNHIVSDEARAVIEHLKAVL